MPGFGIEIGDGKVGFWARGYIFDCMVLIGTQ